MAKPWNSARAEKKEKSFSGRQEVLIRPRLSERTGI
jgi:hypothetical protein